LIKVSAVMVLVEASGDVVVMDQPERPESRGVMDVTGEWKAQMPPASSKEPSRYCIKLWLSTIPVLRLSRTPASARTDGSRLLASSFVMNWVGTPICLEKLWTFCRASICVESWATIHFPVLR
jgi:hypothetical protein